MEEAPKPLEVSERVRHVADRNTSRPPGVIRAINGGYADVDWDGSLMPSTHPLGNLVRYAETTT